MPEYLAPGVYVEETSFRAKSIEGVSTSTTAFVGPSRKGPVCGGRTPVQPELLTSFGDFVRVFGGLSSLSFAQDKPNYLAHAVLNYFNEGGGRLYVLRVADNAQPSYLKLAGTDVNDKVYFRSRFPGMAGNATVVVKEILSSATGKSLEKASVGSVLRAGGASGVEPARLRGKTQGPFAVHDEGVLRLFVNGEQLEIVFHAKATEAKCSDSFSEIEVKDDDQTSLIITVDGVPNTVNLVKKKYSPAELALAINSQLRGGYARIGADPDDNTKYFLFIGTDHQGYDGKVKVEADTVFGFSNSEVTATFAADNNVGDLSDVTADDLNNIISDLTKNDADNHRKVVASNVSGYIELSTDRKGKTATLKVSDATDVNVFSEHTTFGLEPPKAGMPAATGSNVRLYRKYEDGWWAEDAKVNKFEISTSSDEICDLINLSISIQDADGETELFDDVSLSKNDVRYIGNVLSENPTSRADALQHLVWCDIGGSCNSLQLYDALFPSNEKKTGDVKTGFTSAHVLDHGSDGNEPVGGSPDQDGTYAAAFEQLRGLEDVSIVAAPGHASLADYQNIQGLLISHAEKPRAYRIAVLDTPVNQTPGEAKAERARIDSTHAALYYPWVTVSNPVARPGNTEPREIQLPPSGFICGIYARNDVEKSVSKAPANEVIRSALRFERDVNFAENQMLNPLGVNCLRFFPGRGYRVWGARTVSSDPEWKYVNVRRYFNYLESSIDRGTQWAVFENNGERLWTNIRETIEAFLYNEWVSGNLLGASAKEAYFVRCDRSTMTQNDLDNGRLICLIGVAALKPAEFVIFRIGQKTADAKG